MQTVCIVSGVSLTKLATTVSVLRALSPATRLATTPIPKCQCGTTVPPASRCLNVPMCLNNMWDVNLASMLLWLTTALYGSNWRTTANHFGVFR